jgi:hypothetical protein
MTCEYSDIELGDKVYNAARQYPGGVGALALRMEMTKPVLYNKLRPICKTHHLTLDEFCHIIELLEDAGCDALAQSVLNVFAERFNCVISKVNKNNDRAASLVIHVLEATNLNGLVAKAVEDALANDGVIDKKEAARIKEAVMNNMSRLGKINTDLG